MSEKITLDPESLVPNRTELSLAKAGLEVSAAGADWGESAVDLAMVRQDIGEVPSDRHLPNVEMTIPLVVREDGETSLAEALANLQAKVGLWQREGGGWLQRTFDEGGGFAGSVAYRVHSASLAGVQGWLLAHRQVAPEVVLKVVRSPLCYSMKEDEAAEVKEETERELIYTLPSVKGTAEGLRRIVVKNLNTSADWRGLIWAEESRDHPGEATEDTTAALAYEAEDLTPKGGAAVATLSGASGGGTNNVVQHSALTAGFLAVLSSEIDEVGHMTHRGARRIWIRGYDPGSSTDYCELRLRWRALGASRWSENAITPVPLTDGFFLLDLGECRPEVAVVGDERWEFQIQARAPDGSGTIRIDKVYVLPTEQYGVLSEPEEAQSPEAQSTKSPGTLASESSGKAWSNPTNAASSNDVRATAELAFGEVSQRLKATNFGFTLPEGSVVVGVLASIERSGSASEVISDVSDGSVRLVKGGVVEGADKARPAPWDSTDAIATYGGSDDLWELSLSRSDVNASTFGVIVSAKNFGGGATATARVDHITLTVYYSEGDRQDLVCFAERSIELRSDGVFRQHPEDDVWGRVVPDGFLPYAAPSGLEERTSRGILIPTRGDLEAVADSESNDLSAVVKTRAGYHFAREAA